MNMILKKSLKDLMANKSKGLLILFSLIIGLMGVSTIVYTYSITKRDLKDNYLQTNPSSINIQVRGINSEILKEIKGLSFIDIAEVRAKTVVRARSNKAYNWMPLVVFSAPSLQDLELKKFSLEEGDYPDDGEILIERDGLRYLDGKGISIELDNAKQITLERVGSTHDPGRAPSHMEHLLYGYVNFKTYNLYFRQSNTERLLVKFRSSNLNEITDASSKLLSYLDDLKVEVISYDIPPVNEHPHENQLRSLLFLQLGLGGLAVLLSILLLINIINSIMNEQISQIGIMKSIGAGKGQLLQMYMFSIGVISFIAILIALPLGYEVALWYSGYIAAELNFDVLNANIPVVVNISLAVICFMLPLISCYLPINKACSISVNEALSYQNTGVSTKSKTKFISLDSIKPLWLKIGINNSFLSWSRLFLSILTLMLGLALFSVGLNVSNSLDNTFKGNMDRKHFDFTIKLKGQYEFEKVDNVLSSFTEIMDFELWSRSGGSFVDENDLAHNGFRLIGIADQTKMWDINLLEGELPQLWEDNLIVNPQFLGRFKNLAVGDTIKISTAGIVKSYKVKGVIADINGPSAYTLHSNLLRLNKFVSTDIQIILADTNTSYNQLINRIESRLADNNIKVSSSNNQTEFLAILRAHIGIILSFLLAMASLVLVVGGIGVSSLMNIKLSERSQEIKIMKAIGGSKWKITRIIAVEMLLFGSISWLLGWIVSNPLSRVISNFFGKLILETPLDFKINYNGLILSFLVMIAVLVLSGLNPIRKALNKRS